MIQANDLVLTGGSIVIYLSDLNKSGQFTFSHNLSGYTNTRSIFLADVNGDMELDIIAGGKCYLGHGDGTFTDTNQSIGKRQTFKVLGGDLDGAGDSDLDIIAGAERKSLMNRANTWIYYNNASLYHVNSKPSPPSQLNSYSTGSEIILVWNAGYDAESDSLNYFLRV